MNLQILAIEPYYGGSHKAFLDGLARYSRHTWATATMPPRKWKWRMRGAPLVFARQLDRPFDLLLVSDFVDLAALVGLNPRRLADVPKVAYFHENQLTYPVQHEIDRDYQYGFTNVTTCLAADRVFFNSAFHRGEFLAAVRTLFKRMPDQVPEGVAERIAERSAVLPLGCDLRALDVEAPPREGTALVLWNHRWEYDKNPEAFFTVLFQLAEAGVDFRLAVAGESFRDAPLIFDVARRRLGERVDHFGFLENRADYALLLQRADIAVSTAHHEFFGIAAVEAMYCNCFPLFPNKLTYPELLPPECHERHLYSDHDDLVARLRSTIADIDATRQVRLHEAASRFDWSALIERYDAELEAVASSTSSSH